MSTTRSGGCRCGAVRYELTGDPSMSVLCHCRDCQLSTGGPFAVVVLHQRPDVRSQGETRTFTVTADSGGTVTRHFCPVCGSPLWSEISEFPDMIAIKAGSLDDPSSITPSMEVWTERAVSWAHVPKGLPTFSRNPG